MVPFVFILEMVVSPWLWIWGLDQTDQGRPCLHLSVLEITITSYSAFVYPNGVLSGEYFAISPTFSFFLHMIKLLQAEDRTEAFAPSSPGEKHK